MKTLPTLLAISLIYGILLPAGAQLAMDDSGAPALSPPIPPVLQGKVQLKRPVTVNSQPTDAGVKLKGGLRVNRVGGQSMWLQQQQARFDPITRQTIIELVQRQAPQRPVHLPAQVDRLLPLPNIPDSLFDTPLLPAPNATLPSSIDEGKFEQKAAQFDDQCHTLKWQWSSDQDEATRRLDQTIADLHQRFDKRQQQWLATNRRQQIWLAQNEDIRDELRQRTDTSIAKFEAEYEAHAQERQSRMDELASHTRAMLENQTTLPFTPANQDDTGQNITLLPEPRFPGINGDLQAADPDANVAPATPLTSHQRQPFDVIISWDEWYARLVRDIKQPLINAVSRHGNPVGKNTIRVTVRPGLRIEVLLENGGNPAFDAAVLEAYRSLMFTPTLEFPQRSKRSSVTFLSDHVHKAPGAAIDIDANELTGDVEHQKTIKL